MKMGKEGTLKSHFVRCVGEYMRLPLKSIQNSSATLHKKRKQLHTIINFPLSFVQLFNICIYSIHGRTKSKTVSAASGRFFTFFRTAALYFHIFQNWTQLAAIAFSIYV